MNSSSKFDFNIYDEPYKSSRFSMLAKNGMVCSTSSLASQAGLEMLKRGGNAVDAAVATAAVLSVVEPTSNGLGSDSFAIIWMKDKMYGMNASGFASEDITIDKVKALGYSSMPRRGWLSVMVPGAPKAWARCIERFGNLSLKEVLQPAIEYAENGFPVGPTVAWLWKHNFDSNVENFKKDKAYNEFFNVFAKDKDQPYQTGDIFKNPKAAKTLRLIAETDAKEFYEGKIAEKMVEQAKRDGGFLTLNDLKNYDVEWVEPISLNYRGYDIWELPPNGQGIVALMSLNILKNFDFKDRDSVETVHKQMEAMKMGFVDGHHIVTDPRYMKVDYQKYLTDDYGKQRAKEITDQAILPQPIETFDGGTVYLSTADKDGNMVSYIQSNYQGFGSGIVIEDYGLSLQNRAYGFSLDPNAANALLPRKRSYHTIIPGFITKDNQPLGPFGVMGGNMQPQGHLQVAMNLIDFNLNPQMCLDAPRWQWMKGNSFIVEPEFDKKIVEELIKKGHDITYAKERFLFGRGQIIFKDKNCYIGATESRADSNIACY